MEKNQFLIGAFSHKTGVSKRMLRHYDKLDLLSPANIDEDTGYRFYKQEQILIVKKIQHLQDFGFTLKTIKELINTPIDYHNFLSLLKDQEAVLRNDTDEMVHHLLKLKSFINYVESNPTQINEIPLNEFELKRSIAMDKQDLKDEIRRLPRSDVFYEKIEELCGIKRNTKAAFITFDIDNFICVNDQFGYDVGDQVIAAFYQQIKSKFTTILAMDTDNLFTRVGGDEFALFILNPDVSLLEKTVNSTLEAIRAFDYGSIGCQKDMTSSCGVAFGSTSNHHRDLRHQSTKALLEAKRKGRDQFASIQTQ